MSLFTARRDGSRQIVEIADLAKVREGFSDDLLTAFCRCFIWTDRLMSLNFLGLQVANLEPASVRFGRDMETMLWFTCGSLRELGRALAALLATGFESFLEPAKLPLVEEVRGILTRWDNHSFFTHVRDKVSFHVDEEVLRRGLEALGASQGNVIFMESDGRGMGFQRVRLAHDLLVRGLFAPDQRESEVRELAESAGGKKRVQEFVAAVQRDHGRVAVLLEEILIGCLEGLEAGRTRRPAVAVSRPLSHKALLEQTRQALRKIGKHLENWDEGSPLPHKVERIAEELQKCRQELKQCQAALRRVRNAEAPSGEVT